MVVGIDVSVNKRSHLSGTHWRPPGIAAIIKVKLSAEKKRVPQSIGGGCPRPKVAYACHCTHLGKIQGMQSISKPLLLIEIYTFPEIMSTDEFRKKLRVSITTSAKPVSIFHLEGGQEIEGDAVVQFDFSGNVFYS
jgi:hypothetical protein